MNDAVRQEVAIRNPVKAIKKPKVEHKEMTCLTAEQARHLIDVSKEDRYGIAIRLAIDSGMRPGELFAVHWSDVDLMRGTVLVRQSREVVSGKNRLKPPKTRLGRRTINLSRETLGSLKKHRERMSGEGQNVESGLVLVSPRGLVVGESNWRNQYWIPLLERASLPFSSGVLRFYDLRHTCASLLLQAGVSVKVVSERLGHADASMVLRVYGHVLAGMQESAGETMGDILRGVKKRGLEG